MTDDTRNEAAPPAPPAPLSAETPTLPAAAKAVDNQASAKTATKRSARGPKKPKVSRVKLSTPYKLFIHTQKIMVLPDEEPKVELDAFVTAQLEANNLELVD